MNLYTGTDIHDIEVDHTTSTLYWSEGGDIFKAPIGSDLSTNKTQVSPIAAAGIIDEFSLDISGNTVYYVENSEIKKADFNGQNVVPLFDVGAFSGLVPNSIAVDVHGGKIYWSENSAGLGIFIRRINIDGSGTPETIYSFATEQANDIFLDLWP